jgi:hypothetical protein
MTAARSRSFFLLCFVFIFLNLSTLALRAEIPCEWTDIERVVVVGDLHGDYENFVKILRGTQLVDRDLHWKAGQVHLVQMGDILDRGREARKIFDLLIQMQKEAEDAGGKVHVLFGNHEEMNVTGIVFSSNPDYVTLDQFISFLPEAFRKQQEDLLAKRITKRRPDERGLTPRKIMDAFWSSVRDTPSAQRQYVLNLNEEYGDWLRRLNVAIKINDVVFVHGGISEKYSGWGLAEINDRYRLEIADYWRAYRWRERPRIVRPLILYRGDSPLWYRALATLPEEDLKEELDQTLDNLGAKVMIIAHTPKLVKTPEEMQRFGGKVWIVDTGISSVYGGNAVALIIQNGYFNVWGLYDEDKNESGFSCSSFAFWHGFFHPVSNAR